MQVGSVLCSQRQTLKVCKGMLQITTFNILTVAVFDYNIDNIDIYYNHIILNVMHTSMFRNYSFNFGRNVAKRGRNMERRRERNIVDPKLELKSFRPSSCVFYGRGYI